MSHEKQFKREVVSLLNSIEGVTVLSTSQNGGNFNVRIRNAAGRETTVGVGINARDPRTLRNVRARTLRFAQGESP